MLLKVTEKLKLCPAIVLMLPKLQSPNVLCQPPLLAMSVSFFPLGQNDQVECCQMQCPLFWFLLIQDRKNSSISPSPPSSIIYGPIAFHPIHANVPRLCLIGIQKCRRRSIPPGTHLCAPLHATIKVALVWNIVGNHACVDMVWQPHWLQHGTREKMPPPTHTHRLQNMEGRGGGLYILCACGPRTCCRFCDTAYNRCASCWCVCVCVCDWTSQVWHWVGLRVCIEGALCRGGLHTEAIEWVQIDEMANLGQDEWMLQVQQVYI